MRGGDRRLILRDGLGVGIHCALRLDDLIFHITQGHLQLVVLVLQSPDLLRVISGPGLSKPDVVHPRQGVGPLFLRRLQGCLGPGQLDAVFLRLDEDVSLGGVDGGQLLLVRLGHGVLLPGVRIGPEGRRAAVDLIVLQVDVLRQVRHGLAEQGQGVVVLLLCCRRAVHTAAQGVQPVDVHIRQIGGG